MSEDELVGANHQEKIAKYKLDGLYGDLPEDVKYGIDAVTIVTILTLVIQLVRLFVECNKSAEEVKELVENPTDKDKKILMSLIRKNTGFRKYRRHGNKIADSLVKYGRNLSTDDVTTILEDNRV